MVPIGNSVLRQACQAAGAGSTPVGLSDAIVVSVNLSPSELAQRAARRGGRPGAAESELPPERLTLELSESDVMRDLGSAQRAHAGAARARRRLVLDDFGTGHSSLEPAS